MSDTLKPEELFGESKPKKTSCPELMNALAPPPRGVSLGARGTLLLTRNTGCFGWVFFLFGAVVSWAYLTMVFDVLDVVPSLIQPWETLPQPGRTIQCKKTNLSVNDSPMYQLTFECTADGQTQTKTCKTLQSRNVGETFPVERKWNFYRPQKKVRWEDYFPLIVLIFPTVGLCLVVCQFRSGWRAIHLLKHGEAAVGVPGEPEETGVKYNKRPQYKVDYFFQTLSGESRTAPILTYDLAFLSDKNDDTLLYDPHHPERILSLDDFQKELYVTSTGDIAMRWTGSVSLILWFVVVSAACVVVYFLL